MPLYSEEKKEQAYQAWARMSDKTNPHAIRQLSQQVGLPIKLIYDWRDRYGWVNRWLVDVQAVAPQIVEQGMTMLVQGWPMVAGRLLSIVQTGSDKDAVNAAKAYAAIVGAQKVEPMAPQKSVKAGRKIEPGMLDRVKGMSREELWQLAGDAGADNMDKSLQLRQAKRLRVDPE